MTYTEDEIKLLIRRLREKAVKKDTPLSCSGDMYAAAGKTCGQALDWEEENE